MFLFIIIIHFISARVRMKGGGRLLKSEARGCFYLLLNAMEWDFVERKKFLGSLAAGAVAAVCRNMRFYDMNPPLPPNLPCCMKLWSQQCVVFGSVVYFHFTSAYESDSTRRIPGHCCW